MHDAGMADPRHRLGATAESAVSRWLAMAGWTIIDRRRRTAHGGEVDLVAIDPAGFLVAVEVRARRTSRTGGAAFSVDERRVARLRRSLAVIGGSSGREHTGLRVDLVIAEPVTGVRKRWRLTRIPGIG